MFGKNWEPHPTNPSRKRIKTLKAKRRPASATYVLTRASLCFDFVLYQAPAAGYISPAAAILTLLLRVGPLDCSVVETDGFAGKIVTATRGDMRNYHLLHIYLHVLHSLITGGAKQLKTNGLNVLSVGARFVELGRRFVDQLRNRKILVFGTRGCATTRRGGRRRGILRNTVIE